MAAARRCCLLAALTLHCWVLVDSFRLHGDPVLEFQAALKRSALGAIDLMRTRETEGRGGEPGFVLVTSLFVPTRASSEHTVELFTALLVNTANPFIEAVHVLLESGGEDACRGLPAMLTKHAAVAPHRDMAKITCVPVGRQPTYADFFRYANSALAQRDVLLANTDVVFDETLALLERPVRTDLAHVLSVQPPPYAGRYKELLGKECPSEVRCAMGGYDGFAPVDSWDAYAFRSPLPQGMNFTSIDHVMNLYGAELGAAYELERNCGRKVSNPCMHVHAFHWHCIGGKMHKSEESVNDVHEGNLVCVPPCWHCPGMRAASAEAPAVLEHTWCSNGEVAVLSDLPESVRRNVSRLFRFPPSIKICLSEGADMQQLGDKLLQRQLPVCRAPSDMDCVVGFGERVGHQVRRR